MKTVMLGIASLLVAVMGLAAESGLPAANGKALEYFVVVTGGELLEGVYPDAHTPFIARKLRPLGCRCAGVMVVDDVRDEILKALEFATNHAPLVLITGGLGPTPNDITRETISTFSGIPLREHPEVLAQMEKRFQHPKEQLRANLRRQCLVPERGGYLPNPNGTAVGLVFAMGDRTIVALPGPPRELQGMVQQELLPWLRDHYGVRPLGASLTLRFVGVGQSQVDQTIKDHIKVGSDVTITSLFEGSRVDFTFSVPGNTPADRARLAALEKDVREHLEEYLYADDGSTLEQVVLRQLQARGGLLALVEVGSGGQLTAALQRTKGAEALIAGAFCAPTIQAVGKLLRVEETQMKRPDEAGLRSLGQAAAKLTGSRCVVVIGPPEANPGGGQSIRLLCLAPEGREIAKSIGAPPQGEIGGASLVTSILDWLRRVTQ